MSILVATGLLVAAGTGTAVIAQDTRAAAAAAPNVIAVKFHADWCGSCRAMGPVMTDLQNKFDGDPALFVTLDLTNNSTSHQAELHASALGLGELWASNGGKTGRVYLVDSNTGEVLSTLTKEHDLKAMSAELKDAI
jgi:thiol-disulfide isomerase/thioredoxin